MDRPKRPAGAEQILKFYDARGYQHSVGAGRRPAVVIIDFSNAFTRGTSQFPGGDFSAEMEATRRLLTAARNNGVPIFYTTIAYANPEREFRFLGQEGSVA